jgi:hypothetical protein
VLSLMPIILCANSRTVSSVPAGWSCSTPDGRLLASSRMASLLSQVSLPRLAASLASVASSTHSLVVEPMASRLPASNAWRDVHCPFFWLTSAMKKLGVAPACCSCATTSP